MIEILSSTIVSKTPVKIVFTSDFMGRVGLQNFDIKKWVACSRGVAFELLGPIKTRSVINDGLHWFNFRPRDFGFFANDVSLSEALIEKMALENPDMVCHSLDEIRLEHLNRDDFRRSRRPFVLIDESGEPCWVVLWEYYPSERRIGVYVGVNQKGLGGYVRFYDLPEFKIL